MSLPPVSDMESSPANRLLEADSLPDGFVESSTEPPAAPPDSKDALHGLGPSGERGDGLSLSGASETLTPESLADGLHKLTTKKSTDFLSQKDSLDHRDDSVGVEHRILMPTPDNDPSEKSKEMNSPQNEISVSSSSEESRGDCQSSGKDAKGSLELHTTNWKERSTVEYADSLKHQKDEAKRKAVKRGIKSEEESLEFTLNYQKVIAERDAAVAVRERLEPLCRELQCHNKMLMDECQRLSTEGQNMRLDLSTKFNDAIKDVSSKLEEQKNECLSQLKDNEMLRNKLKHLADQYALSEQQFAQKLKQKTPELQLADVKIRKQLEKSGQEQTQMQLYAEQIAQLMATEKSLHLQLAADGEKFQQFQEALSKSNNVFEAFKQEMEEMAKLIKELEKENEFLKNKCEKSDIALVNLVEERELMKKQLEKVKNQKEKLESLCRSLHAERKQNLVGSNTDPVSMQVTGAPANEDSQS
ncbi:alpha-taxilin-like isoform X2 [Phoenix dactylifera]|uniref:Alpha-taxilin-like isoform X2 n=1 Tax=Phoenix dactylifera TaxID=42345 RepID=A0A8B9AAH9_PHODC|nr:alpha-taxilin-like isoform X2 [Phoenix dactylifera]